MGDLQAAEDLDAIVVELEALIEDTGDFEDGELPEDETHDDDLAWERGPDDPNRLVDVNDDTDGDLEFLHLAETEAAHP